MDVVHPDSCHNDGCCASRQRTRIASYLIPWFDGHNASANFALSRGARTAYENPNVFGGMGATTGIPHIVECVVSNGVNAGTLIPRFRSEVSGSAVTVKGGSVGQLIEIV